MTVTIYHNPRCSKSRATLALLEERGLTPEIVEYLQTPPDSATLTTLLDRLRMRPRELMRTGEAEFKAARARIDAMTDAEQIDWLVRHPQVIERPIVVSGKRACIGRPPEKVLSIVARA